MNEEQTLRKLASAARADRPPLVDVVDAVLADLPAPVQTSMALLWSFTAATSAAAAAVLLAAILTPDTDPVDELLSVMQVMG